MKHISKIYNSHDMVVVRDNDGTKHAMTIKEALYRAKAVNDIAMTSEERDMVTALIDAAAAAKLSRDGQPFSSQALDMLKAGLK